MVADAKHMSDAWTEGRTRPVSDSTIGDLVRAGGRDYKPIIDDCNDARRRIMDEAGDKDE